MLVHWKKKSPLLKAISQIHMPGIYKDIGIFIHEWYEKSVHCM